MVVVTGAFLSWTGGAMEAVGIAYFAFDTANGTGGGGGEPAGLSGH